MHTEPMDTLKDLNFKDITQERKGLINFKNKDRALLQRMVRVDSELFSS